MAENKGREIPIEDGSEKKEQEAAEAAETAEEDKSCEAGEAAETEKDSGAAADKAAEEKTGDDSKEAGGEEQESERYMRLMAEFQNYKKRAAREKSDIHAYANEKIVGELLPVLDNFERALDTKSDDMEGYVKGMELIFTQLKTALESAGLSEIPALGEEFDPKLHNAVMTEASEEQEDGTVSKVLQKGYKLNDKVIRPSMVAVVRK